MIQTNLLVNNLLNIYTKFLVYHKYKQISKYLVAPCYIIVSYKTILSNKAFLNRALYKLSYFTLKGHNILRPKCLKIKEKRYGLPLNLIYRREVCLKINCPGLGVI